MKICILKGSPRKHGNTASLTALLEKELESCGSEVTVMDLFDKSIKPCIACKTCQDVADGFGCPLEDDQPLVWSMPSQMKSAGNSSSSKRSLFSNG